MRTVLHVGAPRKWTGVLGPAPWSLVMLGNRPLLEYWFELSVDRGVTDVHLVLGDGADRIESYAGDGSRWGLRIQYSFLREDRHPLTFLRRNPALWRDGLLFLSGPLFPRRLLAAGPLPPAAGGLYTHCEPGGNFCALSTDAASLDLLLAGEELAAGGARSFAEIGLELNPVESVSDFFAINMQLAHGEMSRYLAPGYGAADGSCVGYNVVIPPSAAVAPSVILGNHCRICPMASVGPCAVIGDHVLVDRQAELENCVVLAGTYIGRQVELRDKIVSGRRLIDPSDGEFVDLEDTWLLAGIQPSITTEDLFRAMIGWLLACVFLCLQLVPFAMLYTVLRLTGRGCMESVTVHGRRRGLVQMWHFRPIAGGLDFFVVRLFYALGLDLTPRMAGAVCGKWWGCGHEPLRAPEENAIRDELTTYYPAVFSYATARGGSGESALTAMEARYYVENRGVWEDLRIIREALAGRMKTVFGGVRNP